MFRAERALLIEMTILQDTIRVGVKTCWYIGVLISGPSLPLQQSIQIVLVQKQLNTFDFQGQCFPVSVVALFLNCVLLFSIFQSFAPHSAGVCFKSITCSLLWWASSLLSPRCPGRGQTLGACWLISSVSLPASPPMVTQPVLLSSCNSFIFLVITSLSPQSSSAAPYERE